LTSFIGRAHELDQAKERIESARLLTMIGPGGTGKSRLSLRLGADLLPEFSDGVWLVELAPISDPGLILQSVANVLGLREQVGMPLETAVSNFLQAKTLLLILDNCEHLVEACAQMAGSLLQASPHLKILASSREALGIGGEVVYRVPSLTLPEERTAKLEALAACEAVQLFVVRASAVNPRFALTVSNAPAVVQICRRLDGIPLALELAAARLAVFSAEQIAARLDDRFKLLTGGSRTALPRQQTLRALIDWSYEMLAEDERALLRRLSVFLGGWALEAAESMHHDLDALQVLTQLVNKSLVSVDEQGEEPRYRLLETVRQYARDKLLESGEASRERDRHMEYFAQLAESAESGLMGSHVLTWVRRLEEEYDNTRGAIEWAMDHQIEAALRMTAALSSFWFRRGYETEGRHWCEETLQRAEALPAVQGPAGRKRGELLARAWLSLARLVYSQGDNPLAISAAGRSVEYARSLGDKKTLSMALGFELAARTRAGQQAGLEAQAEESVALARESGDEVALGLVLGVSAFYWRMRQPEKAKVIEAEAIARLRESGDRFSSGMVRFGMAVGAMREGRIDEARVQFTELVQAFVEIGDKHRVNMIRSELAHIERSEGETAQAASMYRETIVEWQRLGHRAAVAHQLECFAALAREAGRDENSARLFAAAEVLREGIRIEMTESERIEHQAELTALRSSLDERTFEAAWAAGRALPMEQAVEEAVQGRYD
jgi:non-specific serine/threonine protein kinase